MPSNLFQHTHPPATQGLTLLAAVIHCSQGSQVWSRWQFKTSIQTNCWCLNVVWSNTVKENEDQFSFPMEMMDWLVFTCFEENGSPWDWNCLSSFHRRFATPSAYYFDSCRLYGILEMGRFNTRLFESEKQFYRLYVEGWPGESVACLYKHHLITMHFSSLKNTIEKPRLLLTLDVNTSLKLFLKCTPFYRQ